MDGGQHDPLIVDLIQNPLDDLHLVGDELRVSGERLYALPVGGSLDRHVVRDQVFGHDFHDVRAGLLKIVQVRLYLSLITI